MRNTLHPKIRILDLESLRDVVSKKKKIKAKVVETIKI